jgi:hypothetical protein
MRETYNGTLENHSAELFFTVVFFIINFYFIWPISHVKAWLLMTTTVAISLALIIPRIGIGLGVLVFATGLVSTYFVPPMSLPETETHGWLIPANDPNPALGICEGPKDALRIFFGSNIYWTTLQDAIVITLHRHPMLTIHRTKKGLQIDADIFNSSGEGVVHIERNEFHLIKGEHEVSYAESRETDRSTLLVRGPQFQEVLFIHYLNPRALRVRGIFYAPNFSNGIAATETETRWIDPNGVTNKSILGHNCLGSIHPLLDNLGLLNFGMNG